MDVKLTIPKNWQDFEDICHKLWREIWNDNNAQKNGRNGQSQNGIDIFGLPKYTEKYHGVQCKDKDGGLCSKLTKKELEVEAKKAINFKPQIESFTLATTSSRDVNIQKYCRILTNQKKFPFTVNVWFWDDIENEICYRGKIIEHYYPEFKNKINQFGAIKLDRYYTKDHLDAFFSRQKMSDNFKSFFMPVIYELIDNAYKHGKSTVVKIDIQNNIIKIEDNGLKYNPLKARKLLPITSKNIGLNILHQFIKKLKKNIEVEYRRVKKNNVLSFKIHKKFLKYQDKFTQINIEHMLDSRATVKQFIANDKMSLISSKQIIVNINEVCAISALFQFIEDVLKKLNSNQVLIINILKSSPYLRDIKRFFKDKRLKINYVTT